MSTIEPVEFESHRAEVCAESRQLSVWIAKCGISTCCRLVNTLDVQLCHCVHHDMVDWAWGSVARSIGVSRYYLLLKCCVLFCQQTHKTHYNITYSQLNHPPVSKRSTVWTRQDLQERNMKSSACHRRVRWEIKPPFNVPKITGIGNFC